MEMSVHIDNQPFKVIHKQQRQKQWSLQPWGILVRSEGLLSCSTIMRTSHWNATLLRITLSLGLGYLLGTYRIQIWSKLRNRLRTTTMLVHRRTKVSNYVSSCTGTNYYYSVYLKYLKMNTQEQQTFDYTEWNCTSGRPERLRSELSCHSLGFLLSLLCRAMLSSLCSSQCSNCTFS